MRRILIVEDNELNQDMLSRRLRRKGFEVDLAETGSRGLEKAKSWMPDLILMDMSLPDLDGLEVTLVLKSDSATRHIPIIGLTAHAMASDRDRALQVGCSEFDTKPVDLPRLIGKMEAVLGHDRTSPKCTISGGASNDPA